MTAQNLIDNL